MTCIDAIDPGDVGGGGDPSKDPPVQINVSDGTYIEVGTSKTVEFDIFTSPINFVDAVQVTFSTSNGTALAGTHYTARTAVVVTIPAGSGTSTQSVDVLTPTGATGDKLFHVTLSSPVNATLGDSTSDQVIHYSGGGGGGDPALLPSALAWPNTGKVLYDEFAKCPDNGACTGFSSAGAVSALAWVATGQKITYDAEKLYVDTHLAYDSTTGLCTDCNGTGCTGFSTSRVLDHLVSTGAKVLGGSAFRKISSWNEISDPVKSKLVDKLKRAIYYNGAVLVDSIWYSNWNTAGIDAAPNNIFPDMSGADSSIGHTYILVGWDDNVAGTGKGCFRVQNCFGIRWGNGGRAWLPYSIMQLTSWVSPHPRWRYYRVLT